MPAGGCPFTSNASRVAAGPCSTIFSSSRPGIADDLLGALDVGHARQLHQNLVAVLPLLRDARLGDAELVDAALDGFAALNHGVRPQAHLQVRLHREGVGAVGAGVAIEAGGDLGRGLTEHRGLGGRNPFDAEMRRIDQRHGGDRRRCASMRSSRSRSISISVSERSASSVFDAQDEVHAALEVEPELELLVHQQRRANECRATRRPAG